MMYDLAIIGGGPAGVSAGVYAARKRLKTIFLAESVGGQSTDSVEIQNWIGTPKISGLDLAKSLDEHLRAYASDVVDIHIGARATKVEKIEGGFSIQTNKDTFEACAVLVATGGSRRKLDVPGAVEFENKGVTYCASCDGPMFTGQDTVVVGGGNAGFETAAQLLAYAKSVTLVHRSSDFARADAATVNAVLAHPNMRALVNLDDWGRVKVDGKSQRASLPGIWSAGDCSNGLYHQNNIAAGDAVKALEDIFFYLRASK